MTGKRADAPQFKNEEDWGESARMLKVMAHPVRLLILDALASKSLCVMDLNTLIPIPQPHLSQHMAALRKAELVDSHCVTIWNSVPALMDLLTDYASMSSISLRSIRLALLSGDWIPTALSSKTNR